VEQPLWKSVQRFLKKLKIELPYDATMPVLGIYPKECKSASVVTLAALFTIAKLWKTSVEVNAT
jgi:hypothetical protein